MYLLIQKHDGPLVDRLEPWPPGLARFLEEIWSRFFIFFSFSSSCLSLVFCFRTSSVFWMREDGSHYIFYNKCSHSLATKPEVTLLLIDKLPKCMMFPPLCLTLDMWNIVINHCCSSLSWVPLVWLCKFSNAIFVQSAMKTWLR